MQCFLHCIVTKKNYRYFYTILHLWKISQISIYSHQYAEISVLRPIRILIFVLLIKKHVTLLCH